MTQYTDSYSTISSAILNLFYSKLSITDKYIIFQTGDREYSMLVEDVTGTVTQYIVSRSDNYSTYDVLEQEVSDFSYTVSREYYVYSNVGVGTMSELPCHSITVSWATLSVCCVILLAVMFRGLFNFRRGHRYW